MSPRVVGVIERKATFDPSADPEQATTSRSPVVTGVVLPVEASIDARLTRPRRATFSTRTWPDFDQIGRVGAEPRGGCWSPERLPPMSSSSSDVRFRGGPLAVRSTTNRSGGVYD